MAEETAKVTAPAMEELHDESIYNAEIPQTKEQSRPTPDRQTSGDACFDPRTRVSTQPQENAEPPTIPASMSSGKIEVADEGILFLNDAVQRKLPFPFKLARTWHGMEDLVQQACGHLNAIGAQVKPAYRLGPTEVDGKVAAEHLKFVAPGPGTLLGERKVSARGGSAISRELVGGERTTSGGDTLVRQGIYCVHAEKRGLMNTGEMKVLYGPSSMSFTI